MQHLSIHANENFMQSTIQRTRHQIYTVDVRPLTAYCHDSDAPFRATLVIMPGMAIPQHFYSEFANYFAGLGYRVWTFDYRGMGESATGPLRRCTASLSDWVRLDGDAMVRHAHATGAGAPVFLIGHSLGGQGAPLLSCAAHLNGLVNIAVGSGAAQHNQPAARRMAPLLWHALVPVLTTLFGYFPGQRIGVIGNVPRRAMAQWRTWCLHPEYLLGAEPGARAAYASVRYPVLGLTFCDDELLLETGSKMLHAAFTGAEVDYRELASAQFGLARIGHFGFFRKAQGAVLWPLVGQWLGEKMARIGQRSTGEVDQHGQARPMLAACQ